MSVPVRRLQGDQPVLVLACEGRDDRAFLEGILDSLQIYDRRIDEYRGKPALARYLRGLRDSDYFDTVRAVGIVRDADESPNRAWQSVRDALRRLDLPCPNRPGLFQAGPCGADGQTRTIGVFIVPDAQSEGALEDLCLRAVAGDPALVCAQELLDCVRAYSGVVCPEQHIPKARLNAWLASRANPTLRLGQAIASRDIPPDSDAFGPIRQFLQDLAAAATSPSPDDADA